MKKKRNCRSRTKKCAVRKFFLTMKLTFLLLFIGLMQLSASVYSQHSKLSLDLNNCTVKEALQKIEEQSEFRFFYNEKFIDLNRRISVKTENGKVENILDEIFATARISYKVMENNLILITPKDEDFTMDGAQPRAISGKVTDLSGVPLPGVSIVIKGTTTGIITDVNGNYSLSNVPVGAVLVFSFVGMKSQEIAIGGKSSIDVILEEELVGIEEVVAIGYGTKKRTDITGSVSVVNMDKLQTIPSQSAEHALQGMAAGVNVIPSSVPGSGTKIFIRGVTNFGDTDPLVIVDGIEQDLNNISAKDIESIQVLKDAGAASIYGVRGANGVILVTTKKGATGTPVITYEGTYGVQYPLSGNPFNVLNSENYMKLYNIAFGSGNEKFKDGMPDYMYRGPNGAGVAFEGDPEVDPSLYFYESPNQGNNYIIQRVNKEGTDWFHELFKKQPQTEHNVSVSGANNKTNYFFSLGYLDRKGTLVNTRLQRYTARVNTDFQVGDHIRFGENVSIIYKDAPGFSENTDFGGITETFKQEPIVPLKDIMGNWGGTYGGPSLGDAQNPVAVQYRNIDKDINNTWYIIGNAFAEVDFLKDFTVRSSLGYNICNNYTQNFTDTQVENVQGNTDASSLTISSYYASTRTFTNTLNYSKALDKHKFEVLIGCEAIHYMYRYVDGSSSNFYSTDFNYLDLDNGTKNITNNSSVSETALWSIFSRLDYSFANKYLFSGTLRRDGSSKFGSNNRYGVFPSFSLAWRLSEESFMGNVSWLNDLKIRGSYGVLGSQNNVSSTNAYSMYGSGMTTTYYDITGSGNSIVEGFTQSSIGNKNTGWEENVVTNIGFDMVVFDNSIDFSFEYYKKSINGLLFTEPLPAVIGGASAPYVNIGDIQNTGVDASVIYRGKMMNDLKYSVGVNFTSYKNKIVDLPDPGYFSSGSNQAVGAMVRNEEGHPISSFYGYKVQGLFDSEEEVEAAATQDGAEPGRFRFVDVTGEGTITADDRVHLGDPNPDFTYGINFSLNYKNFDLSAFFYGSQGNEIYNLTKTYLHFFQFYSPTNKSNVLLNAWTSENKDTDIPKIETTSSFSGCTGSSYFVEDGSFLKLRSLVLGYTISPDILRKISVSKLRLYVEAVNLFTITNYSGLDPELIGGSTSVMGVDRGSYPNNEKGVTFGVSLTF